MQLEGEYGNLSPVMASNQVVVDLTAPTAPANLRLAGMTGSAPVWAWDAASDANLEGYQVCRNRGWPRGHRPRQVRDGETGGAGDQLVAGGSAPYRGIYYLQVRVVDRAGNTSPWVSLGPVELSWPATYSFTYGNTGDRLTQNRFGLDYTYQYSSTGELQAVAQGSKVESFEYDGNSNLIRRTLGDEVWEYEYDYDNRVPSQGTRS